MEKLGGASHLETGESSFPGRRPAFCKAPPCRYCIGARLLADLSALVTAEPPTGVNP